jgi:uroporphyrinogen-III decarboxylase
MAEIDGTTRYEEKMGRIMAAVELRKPDRVPIAFQPTFWLARYGDISYRELMYNYDKACEIMRRALHEFDPDMYYPPHVTTLGPVLESIGFKQLEWPGHGVDDYHPFQYIDREYMTADEYDDFIFDPTGYYLSTYLPRIATAYEGIQELAPFSGLYYLSLANSVRRFASPGAVKSLEALHEAGLAAQALANHKVNFDKEMTGLGYPQTYGVVSIAPFDFFGDYFRGAKGVLTDMRRRPDKLLAAMDKALVLILRNTIAAAKASNNKIVFIPVHWAADSFMSPDQFKTFWWPQFRALMMGLIDNGLIPMPLWEANCTKRLEIISDIPAGKAIYWFELTDLARAKEVLGDRVCLRGNIPASLMATGTPQEVDACCRNLIETVGAGGGFILDCGFGIPDETPLENVRAMYRSVRQYSA